MPGDFRSCFAALIGALLLVGCGGADDDATAPGSPTAARAAYIAKVDPLCKTYKHRLALSSKRFEATQHRAGPEGVGAAVAGQYRRAAALLDQLVAQVRAVDAPPADAGTIETWLGASAAQVDAQRELADAVAAGDQGAVGEAQASVRSAGDEARTAIDGFGFTRCGLPAFGA